MLATTNVTHEKDLHERKIVINKIFTYKYNLAKAGEKPNTYSLDPIHAIFHPYRYRTKRACTQIQNHRCTSRHTSSLQNSQCNYRTRHHS